MAVRLRLWLRARRSFSHHSLSLMDFPDIRDFACRTTDVFDAENIPPARPCSVVSWVRSFGCGYFKARDANTFCVALRIQFTFQFRKLWQQSFGEVVIFDGRYWDKSRRISVVRCMWCRWPDWVRTSCFRLSVERNNGWWVLGMCGGSGMCSRSNERHVLVERSCVHLSCLE